MAEQKFELPEVEKTIADFIGFFSENYAEHPSCKMLVHNLRGAADAVHTIRFDGALSENFKKKLVVTEDVDKK